jgi:hypothetical protein
VKTRLDIPAMRSTRFLLTFITLLLCLSATIAAQIPASFQIPILGYVFESDKHSLHPIVGIPGSSTIDSPIDLGFRIKQLEILAGHRHAIAASPDVPHLLVVNLQNRTIVMPIAGASSEIASIRASADGKSAALYYQSDRTLRLVGGLPENPVIQDTIDLSFIDSPLGKYSIADDGTFALLAFSNVQQDLLYRWEKGRGSQFLATSGKIADMTLMDGDAVIADVSASQIIIFRKVREQSMATLVADWRNGLSQPIAISISKRQEILVADSGARSVFSFDANGQLLRSLACDCLPSGIWPLGDTYRLTNRLDQPVILFDDSALSPRTLFVPALSKFEEALP